jgi:hypothetical protein
LIAAASEKDKAAQKKTPPELLIAAASAAAASAVETGDCHPVEDSVTPPEAASAAIITKGGRQHALRDVQRFKQRFKKANGKDVDLPHFGDTSEDKENEKEDE